MKKQLNHDLEQIKKASCYIALALACITSGCGKNNAPQPSAADNHQTSVVVTNTQANIAESNSKKTVQSAEAFDIANLMNLIPTNEFMFSSDTGWDKFTMPKVQKWVNENLNGKKGRILACMTQCSVTQEDPNLKPDEWTVSIQVAGINTKANRILPIDKDNPNIPTLNNEYPNDQPPSIGVKDTSSFTFNCTEAEARKWDAFSKSSVPAVAVEGDIVKVYFLPRLDPYFGNFIGYYIFVQLENVTVTQSKDTELGAIYACEYGVSMLAQDNLIGVPDEAITEIKRLNNNGDYQQIFLKYNDWDRGKLNVTKLLSFNLNSFNFNEPKIIFTPCSSPPTESEIETSKAAISWPTNSQ